MRYLLLTLSLSACGPRSVGDPEPWAAHWDPGSNSLAVYGADVQEPLLSFPAGSLQLGLVDALDDGRSYDPFYLSNEPTSWRVVRSAEVVESDDDRVVVDLDFGDQVAGVLTVQQVGEGRAAVSLVPAPGVPAAFIRLQAHTDPTEGFYGLGEVFDSTEHRGKVRAMQLEPDAQVESYNNEAHVPVPLIVGTTGWGLFVQDDHPGLFEVATLQDDVVQVTFGVGMQAADGLTFHLYAAEHPLDITGLYYQTTGDPLLPAPWALGPWVWRDENRDQAQVLSDLSIMRELDLPVSGYWIDRPYATGVNSFDFEESMFDDPQGMIDEAHDLGYRMALWHTPYASETGAPEIYAQAAAGGYFPPVHPPVFNKWSAPVDLSNPEAFGWWQGLIRRYTDMGIEGFKLDYAEDVVVGLNGSRLAWRFHDGSDERTMHVQYARLYHQVYAETLPESGGFLLCRTGAWGDQAHVSVVWPGDLDATLARPGDDAGDYISVGGLPAAVVASQSLGVSGFPFFGSDTGGYRHAPTSKEVFTRWFQHTALSTVMQIGTNSNDVAWEFKEENGFDEEMLDWYRQYTRLHLRLFPYQWSYAQRLSVDGRPIQRPLGLAYPELGVHPPHDYMFGEHLLVAPVVDLGATSRDVIFPPGRWIDWFTHEQHSAGPATVQAPLDRLPLFLAQGGIVPMLRPTIDTLAPSVRPDLVDSFADDPGVLHLRVFPGPDSSFEVYDGTIATQSADPVTLSVQPGDVFEQGVVFEVVGSGSAPEQVLVDDVVLDDERWWWDDRTVYVVVGAGAHTVQLR